MYIEYVSSKVKERDLLGTLKMSSAFEKLH